MRRVGWFIDQKHKQQGRVISVRIANKEVTLMQRWAKSLCWILLKRETFPTKCLMNRKGDVGIFLSLHTLTLRKAPFWKG